MFDRLEFTKPQQQGLPDAQVVRNVKALGLPPNWSRADDVALVEGLFMGLKLGEIGARMGKTLQQMTGRFVDLRDAATGHGIVFTLDAQKQLLAAVRAAK